jgi:predicted nucleotidyltransferase
MITQQQIEQLRQTIVDIEHPEQIILFGSYAYGEPHENSDLDILVVNNYNVPRHKRGKEVLQALSYIRFPLDIVFYTPEEINKWRETSLAFITTVMSKGKVLYERKP